MFLEACSGCPHHLLQRVPVSLLAHTLENLQQSGLSTPQVQPLSQRYKHGASDACFLHLDEHLAILLRVAGA